MFAFLAARTLELSWRGRGMATYAIGRKTGVIRYRCPRGSAAVTVFACKRRRNMFDRIFTLLGKVAGTVVTDRARGGW